MAQDEAISADQALRRFMDVVADEAQANPAFRSRLALALKTTIMFEGEEDIAAVDPSEMAVRYSEEKFKRIYGGLSAAKLKAALTSSKLATTPDVRGQGKPALLEMLWKRAWDSAEAQGRT